MSETIVNQTPQRKCFLPAFPEGTISRLESERRMRGMTQTDLAFHSGTHASMISQLERNPEMKLSARAAFKIAAALGYSSEEFELLRERVA